MLVYFSLRGNTAVHEHVSLTGVAMEITEEEHLVVLVAHFHKLFSVIDGWVEEFAGLWPSSVEVCSHKIAPIITINNSIWVKHRYNFENESFSQHLGLLIILL